MPVDEEDTQVPELELFSSVKTTSRGSAVNLYRGAVLYCYTAISPFVEGTWASELDLFSPIETHQGAVQ